MPDGKVNNAKWDRDTRAWICNGEEVNVVEAPEGRLCLKISRSSKKMKVTFNCIPKVVSIDIGDCSHRAVVELSGFSMDPDRLVKLPLLVLKGRRTANLDPKHRLVKVSRTYHQPDSRRSLEVGRVRANSVAVDATDLGPLERINAKRCYLHKVRAAEGSLHGSYLHDCGLESAETLGDGSTCLRECSFGVLKVKDGSAQCTGSNTFTRIEIHANRRLQLVSDGMSVLSAKLFFADVATSIGELMPRVSQDGVGVIQTARVVVAAAEPVLPRTQIRDLVELGGNAWRLRVIHLKLRPIAFYCQAMTSCEEIDLHRVVLIMEPGSIATTVSGSCKIGWINRALVKADRRRPLRMKSADKGCEVDSEDRFSQSTIDGVVLSYSRWALPMVAALEFASVLNPSPRGVVESATQARGGRSAAAELAARAVNLKGTRGEVRTAFAYAAGLARMANSTNRAERSVLRLLAEFGFANRPLVAFGWWMFASLVMVYLIQQSGAPAYGSVPATVETFLAVLCEPLNLFKARSDSASDLIPFTGYKLTAMRAVLALALGHFLVAFSRFTRITLKY